MQQRRRGAVPVRGIDDKWPVAGGAWHKGPKDSLGEKARIGALGALRHRLSPTAPVARVPTCVPPSAPFSITRLVLRCGSAIRNFGVVEPVGVSLVPPGVLWASNDRTGVDPDGGHGWAGPRRAGRPTRGPLP